MNSIRSIESSRDEDWALHRELSANVVGFCRILRQHELMLGPAEQSDALRALAAIDLRDRLAFRWALRATLAKSFREQEIFDEQFDAYWKVWARAAEWNDQQHRKETGATADAERESPPKPRDTINAISDWLKRGGRIEEEGEAAGYSPLRVLTKRDFAAVRTEELQEIARLITHLAKTLATRLSRRQRQTMRRGRIDLRRTMRHNLRRGGALIDLRYRVRRVRKLKLVLLCDVSKSMDLYSRFLIQFLYAFQGAYRRIETFVFSTALHHISQTLKSGDIKDVLKTLSKDIPDWSGGTRIGESLDEFIGKYGPRMLDHQTIILVVSDGLDTGDVELLGQAMERLQRKARKVIWLNPLLGHPDYQPICQGMQAALPYVDTFAPVHNVESLRKLAQAMVRN